MTYLRRALEQSRGQDMHKCAAADCSNMIPPGDNYCLACVPAKPVQTETSGGHVNYYSVHITQPTKPQQQPTDYWAECEDIIEALNMTFPEGEAFKSIWRNAAMRSLGKAKVGDTPLRNAEKVAFFGARMVAIEKGREANARRQLLDQQTATAAAFLANTNKR